MDSVEKKPMNGALASRIRRNLSSIEGDVDTNDLITSLISDSIIDFNDKELISKAGTKKERAIYLVSLLMSRGDRAYDCFLEALRKAKYTHIVDKISDFSSRDRETSDLGAGASHENLVTMPLEKKVANLEGQMLIHKEKIKSLSERLDKVETKEELKIIQLEVNNLQNVEAEKEQEIEKLKSQVQKKEDELSSLAEKTSAQVRQLETEIASLKEKAKIGENELQQYKQDKAELERKLQALLLSTEKEFRKIKEAANASNAKIRELEDSRQKDAKAHDAKIKQLEESQQKILLMLQSMSQGPNNHSPQQPATDACSPQVHKPSPAPLPSNEPSIKPTEPNIKEPKSGQQPSTGPSKQHAEPKPQGPTHQGSQQPKTDAPSRQVHKTPRAPLPIMPTPEPEILGPNSVRQQKPSAGPSIQPTEPKAQVSKAPRAQLSLKEPYIQLPEPKESNQREKP